MPSAEVPPARAGETEEPRPPSEAVAGLLLERHECVAVATVIVLAIALRLISMVLLPGSYHPDEIYQTTEQAHRIAFGYGILPWEWAEGARSPIVAWVMAQAMKSADALWGGPRGYLYGVRGLLVLASLTIVVGAWRLGRRVTVRHGLVSAFVAATWFELVHFASRPLYGSIATMLFVPALVLLSAPREVLRSGRLIAAGLLMGAAVAVRPQIAPAVLFAVAWSARGRIRSGWMPLLLAAALPLLLTGVVDWVWWGTPFHSYTVYFARNVFDGVAAGFGRQPGLWYLLELAVTWGAGVPIFLALAVYGGRRFPMWLGVALVVIVTHSVIAHKEYRFVLLAVVCLLVLAAIGSVDVIERLLDRFGRASSGGRAASWVALLATCWLVSSVAATISGDNRNRWLKRRGWVQSTLYLAEKPDVCGIGHLKAVVFETGGYSHLHQDVPLYFFDDLPNESSTLAFNYLVTHGDKSELVGGGFNVDRCFCLPLRPLICVLRRDGGCVRVDSLEPEPSRHQEMGVVEGVRRKPRGQSPHNARGRGAAPEPLPEVLPRRCD